MNNFYVLILFGGYGDYSSMGVIKPGETKSFYKAFGTENLDDVKYLEYYPLAATDREDRQQIEIK